MLAMTPGGIQKGINGHFRKDHYYWKRTERFDACVENCLVVKMARV
jgi:hypothetical protein